MTEAVSTTEGNVSTVGSEPIVQYCVCQQVDSGIMIECIRGTGGCNGWVHPACCGLVLTQEELEALDSYICPMCEKPSDDYSKMKAMNTALANQTALKEQNQKDTIECVSCQHIHHQHHQHGHGDHHSSSSSSKEKDKEKKKKKKKTSSKRTEEKEEEEDPNGEDLEDTTTKESNSNRQRRSHREVRKKRKSYHIPESDEDLTETEDEDKEIGQPKTKRTKNTNEKKRQRNNTMTSFEEDMENNKGSSDAEFDTDHVPVKKAKKQSSKQQGIEEQQVFIPNMVIEKIMGARVHQQKPIASSSLPSGSTSQVLVGATTKPQEEIMEYFIKWKDFSYLHCSWETKNVLLDIDPGNKMKIKRFHEKEMLHHHRHHHHHHHRHSFGGLVLDDEDVNEREYFNPEYLEVHRILSHRQVQPIESDPAFPDAPIDDGMRYLVKWRVLPYSDATWERACDLKDDIAIEKYKKMIIVPPESEWEPLPRPTLRDYKKMEESPAFGEDKNLKLREYQLEGLNWLLWNYYNERPSILADEMGLGKTIQTLAFVDTMRSHPKIRARGPFLVVAPLSLIAQWQSECETWTTMNCIVYHGNTEAREIIRDYEFYFETLDGKIDKKKPFRFQILVTTYEVAIKDIGILSKIRWRCLVVDEAHRLKNQSSRLVEQLRSLKRDHCVLLTGTPLQNKTEELWALLNFIDGKAFPSVNDFLLKFGDLHDAQQVADLHKMLKPYLLRRVKEDVEKSLPPKEETIIEVELTPVQKQWYRAIYEKNTSFLSRGSNPNNMPNLMNVMMELRKCCNHPYLNNGVEEILNQNLVNDEQRHDMMVKCCGKMVLLDKLLPRLKEGGHKVLIFSQMVRVLDIIEDYLRYVGHLFERLDGNIRGNDRQAAVDRFVKPEYNRFVMLLSTKAGGLGLNLTAADTVIIFDSDWNPQNDLQAQARAHRIGQTSSVKIYRLITKKTYEMHMFHKASLKLGLDKAVLTHMRQEKEEEEGGKKKKKTSKAQETKEIDELLKRGAYDVFREEDDTDAQNFVDFDIDQILQRSTQIVQYEQQAKSSFSKASFVSATTSDDVDIDDPDFWKKAVGLKEPEPSELEGDILPAQRKRTRVARFGTQNQGQEFDSDLDISDEDEKDDNKDESGKTDEKKEPRDWTLNGRDRLQRALMHFGFGRWEVIRSQSGGSRSLDEIEQFAREFVYISGICCMEEAAAAAASGSTSKDTDSPFVKAVVRASQIAKENKLVNEPELPPVLKDDDFLLKLKQGGGRRVLIRLDMLMRLKNIISMACDVLDKKYLDQNPPTGEDDEVNVHTNNTQAETPTVKDNKTAMESSKKAKKEGENADEQGGQENEETPHSPVKLKKPPPSTADVDERVAFHTVERVAEEIDLIDVGDRPSWTLITPWWDREADRNLLLGVFLHGYGRCTQIVTDPRLCFSRREMEAELLKSEQVDAKELVNIEEVEEPSIATDESDGENLGSSEKKEKASKKKEKKSTDSSGTAATTSSSLSSPSDTKFKQPEVQQMNRLLFWLLSAEDIKKQREQDVIKKKRSAQEQKRQNALEKKQKIEAMKRIETKAAHLTLTDILRHRINLVNALQISEVISSSASNKLRPHEWTKEERRNFAYTLALYGAPRILARNASTPIVLEEVKEEEDGLFTLRRDGFSWLSFVRIAKLNKTPVLARSYYHEKFLSKCKEVSHMRLDPFATDSRSNALADLIGIEYVDPHEGVLAHGLKARIIAFICLQRCDLLEKITDFVTNKTKKKALWNYLRSGKEELVGKEMPVWWCPWIHDLGLFYGMAKYGIYGWEKMILDESLPFYQDNIQTHIEKVFGEIEEINMEIPSYASLERRIEWICKQVEVKERKSSTCATCSPTIANEKSKKRKRDDTEKENGQDDSTEEEQEQEKKEQDPYKVHLTIYLSGNVLEEYTKSIIQQKMEAKTKFSLDLVPQSPTNPALEEVQEEEVGRDEKIIYEKFETYLERTKAQREQVLAQRIEQSRTKLRTTTTDTSTESSTSSV